MRVGSRPALLISLWLASTLSIVGAVSSQTAGSVWLREFSASNPSPRGRAGVAYDTVRQVLVLYGGSDFSNPLGDTWIYSQNSAWNKANSVQTPGPRMSPAMAYDEGRGVTVLFGGLNATPQTWEWNGLQWTRNLQAGLNVPAGAHTMAYDAFRGVMVLFTGVSTWEWTASGWAQRAPQQGPRVGDKGSLVYDSSRQRMFWFGGVTTPETWEYDGSWTQLTPATVPPGRCDHGLAHDESRGVTVLYGGRPGGGIPFGDTWEWNGSDWVQTTAALHDRYAISMIYHPERGDVLLFGGFNPVLGGAYAETWRYLAVSGATTRWQQAASLPATVNQAGLVYDTARDVAVLFGGDVQGFPSQAMYERSGTTWQAVTPSVLPPARSRHGFAYDSHRGVTVIFGGGDTQGGYLRDTWEWDGETWVERFPVSAPWPRQRALMAYDQARRRTLLFGGNNFNQRYTDTWEWDGSEWSQLSPSQSPPDRAWSGMAYDAARQRVVWLGGSFIGTETFEWDGSDWQDVTPSSSPPAAASVRLAYDPRRQRVVCFGQSGTWEWNGIDWSRVVTAVVPTIDSGTSGLTYDDGARSLLLVGGRWGSLDTDQVWELETITRADYQVFGEGCTGSAGRLALAAFPHSLPWVGDTFQVELFPLAPGTSPVLIAGTSSVAWGPLPLPFGLAGLGAPGCAILVNPALSFPMQLGGGFATWSLPIPNDPVFGGLAFFVQGLVFGDPVNAGQLATSDAGEIAIGVR